MIPNTGMKNSKNVLKILGTLFVFIELFQLFRYMDMSFLLIKLGAGAILLAIWLLLIYFPRDNADKLVAFIQLCLAGLAGHLLSPS
jgi:hypothetical protein